jgi:hypothetical protein
MNRVIGLGALAVLSFSVPVARAQGTFEGVATFTMTGAGRDGVVRYYQLGNRFRQEFEAGGMTGASILDGATGDMIMLIPQQKAYMLMNLRDLSGPMAEMARGMGGAGAGNMPDFTRLTVTPTGRSETVAGIACEHYLFENAGQGENARMDFCGAPGMGFLGSPDMPAGMIPSTVAMLKSTNPELARLAERGFFPLKMVITTRGRDMTIEATSVDRTRPDASLFEAPAGYTRMEMPAMPK